ncbi:DinB family protein [Cellulomonas timonensis]|uniref:DinB family protein n=1 Tax=Cellulomonas timonensis TaxID=1689271 RepID=UPI000829E0BD|nr:DinB family protein [Cellulomonas timonensis]
MDPQEMLHSTLQTARADLLGKLDGLGEYDIRRPMTPTGTSLLGLVKHVASVQLGYFGEVFGRPADRVLPWYADGADPEADMWATADETREEIVDLHHYSAEHSDATIRALPLDAVGEVPWWRPENRVVTLHKILVHMSVETSRHAGHADIIRELIDGSAGLRAGDANVAGRGADGWAQHHARVEAAARQAASRVDDGAARL